MTISIQSTTRRASRGFATLLALTASTAAMAQVDEPWEGTYEGNVGTIRFVQDGDRVYGDYETKRGNFGVIEARVSQDGMTIRGTYQNLKARTDNALLEFRLTDTGFIGSWTQFHNYRTVSWEGARWVARHVSTTTPPLTHASAQGLNYAGRFPRTVSRLRRWAMFDQGVDVSQTVLWKERGYTGLRDGPEFADNGNASAAEEEMFGVRLPDGARRQRADKVKVPNLKADAQSIENRAKGLFGRVLGGQKKPEDDEKRFPGEMHQPEDGGGQ